MFGKLRTALMLLAMSAVWCPCPIPLQAQKNTTISRKVKMKVEPAYPVEARRMGLAGTVKLLVVVAPNGSVMSTKVIGGHPLLVVAAQQAIKDWKFEPGAEESSGVVEFRFDPAQ
jgi:TonB family protein